MLEDKLNRGSYLIFQNLKKPWMKMGAGVCYQTHRSEQLPHLLPKSRWSLCHPHVTLLWHTEQRGGDTDLWHCSICMGTDIMGWLFDVINGRANPKIRWNTKHFMETIFGIWEQNVLFSWIFYGNSWHEKNVPPSLLMSRNSWWFDTTLSKMWYFALQFCTTRIYISI